jgi:methylenetetrahydrofolate reductase (NADPH)
MPIQSYNSFQKMTTFCKTKVPSHIWDNIAPIRDNDEEVKSYGIKLCYDMCRKLKSHGIPYFHFYTLNLERSVLAILRLLGAEETTACRR